MTEILCAYCGTLAQVHEADRPLPPRAPDAGPPMVVHLPARGPSPLLWIVPAVVGLGIGLMAVLRSTVGGAGVGVAGLSGTWSFDDTPMLADANGDGVPDVIGHVESGDVNYLAAFEGATGKLLWKSEGPKESFKGKRAIVGDVFIVVDELGKVQATRISNGTPAWAGLLSDKAESFCRDGSSAIIEASDKTFTRFELATGKKSAVDLGGKKQPACAPVYQTRDETPTYQLIDWPEFKAHNLPELNNLPGMAAHRALVPASPGIGFQLGSKDTGTQVAMVAAVENGKVLWKEVVPGIEPLKTDVNVTTIIAASDGAKVVIPYGMRSSNDGVRMACFDARSGTRLWDMQVHKVSNVDQGITIEAGRIYYASWTALYVLSMQDGKLLYELGHDF